MKSMKCDPPKEMSACSPVSYQPSGPVYPYGLQIHLGTEELKKLGIDELPEVGKSMKLTAEVEVCAASHDKSMYGESKSVRLQITDMELGKSK